MNKQKALQYLQSLRFSHGYRYSKFASKAHPLSTVFALIALKLLGRTEDVASSSSLDFLQDSIWADGKPNLTRILTQPEVLRYQALQLLSYTRILFDDVASDRCLFSDLIVTKEHWDSLLASSDPARMWFHSNEWMALAAIAAPQENGKKLLTFFCDSINQRVNEFGMVGQGTLRDQAFGVAHFGPMFRFTGVEWAAPRRLLNSIARLGPPNRFISKWGGVCEELDICEIYSSLLRRSVPSEYANLLQRSIQKAQNRLTGVPYFLRSDLLARVWAELRRALRRSIRYYNNEESMPYSPFDADVWGTYGAGCICGTIGMPLEAMSGPIWGYGGSSAPCAADRTCLHSESACRNIT